MLRRLIALAVAVATAASLAPAVTATPAAADPPTGPVIAADETVEASVTVVDGTLEVVTAPGGPTTGNPPAQAAATASSGVSTDATGEWPTGNRDRSRTGNAAWEEFITIPAGAAWTNMTTDKVQLNPAIVDDVAYFGGAGADKRIYAVDLQTGDTIWSVGLPGSVLSSPAVAGGWVYFASADGRVYRLAAETGELSWQFPSIGNVGGFIGALAVHDGVVYAGSTDANLYAIDAISGDERWRATTPEAISGGVSVADGKVVVPSGANEWLTALDTASHAQVWQRKFYDWATASTLGTAASISAGRVYLTGLDSKLHILDVTTGADAVTPPNIGSWAQNTPVPAANKVFIGTNNGRVLAFDPATGAQLWATTLNTAGGIVTSPVFAGAAGKELVFAASTDGSLYGLNALTGSRDWQYTTGGSLFAPPAIVSNHLLIGSDDHKLYGLVPGLPDNRSYAPPPPLSHTYGMQPWQQYSWDPVATSTGNYIYQHTDLALPSRGLPIGFARSYNSLDATTAGPLGYGWTYNAAATLTPAAGSVTIRWGDGHTDTYTGNGPTYTPPADGHDTLVASAGGWELSTRRHLRYQFDSTGKLTAMLDSSGNQTILTYDETGRLASMTDASAHTLTLGYDASNRITSVTDPLGRSWTYTYSPAGDLATAADHDGNTWRYGYDAGHHLTTLTDPDNNLVIDNTYDTQGRVIDQTDSAGGVWAYTYNTGSTVVTDPLGHAITYTYDSNYRTTAMTNALGNTTRWIYDEQSNLLATVDPTGRASQFHYDANGNLTATLDPLGHKTALAYDANDNLTSVTNLKGHTATFAYDTLHRLTDTTTATGVHSQITYRPDGLVNTVIGGAGQATTYGYDANGMLQSVTDPLNRTSTVTIDAAGQVTATTDPLNRTTSYHYDPAGRPDVITDPAGNTIRYGYDNTGRTTSYTDQNNHTTTYGYNTRGLLETTTDPLGRVDTTAYDSALRVTATTNARGQTINYGYDNADRLTTIDYPAGTPDVTRTLDPAGRPLAITDGTGTTTYTYDTGGRLTREHRQLANATIGHRYDTLNRRSRLTLNRSGGLTARNLYDYDADGRLSTLTDSAGGETHFDYDPAGRLATLAHPNAVVAAYAYDPAGQVTDLTNTRTATATSPANAVSGYHYTYDPAGQRTSAARSVAGQAVGTSTYTYDTLGRLTGATNLDPTAPLGANATWSYDPAGNRTRQAIHGAVTTNYSYDDADQLTSDGTHTYTWDPDGNLTNRRVTLTGTTVAAYTWDPANRITSQTSGDQTTSYTYDGQSRRVTKADPSGTSTYLFDGGDLLEELNPASGGDTVETTAGGTVLNRIGLAGTTYLHSDANANIGELTDQNGTTLARNAYTPWGGHTTTGGPALDPYQNRHTFAGATGVRDDNGGLIDMRNRMYDPNLGIFISRDPLEATTHDPYGYAAGNPISMLDPYGLWPWDDKCITFLDDDCESYLEQWGDDHPEAAQHVVNFAGGVLDANPITAWLPLDLEGHGVDTSSGWFSAGQTSMFLTETGFGATGAGSFFNTGSSLVYAGSACTGWSGDSCADASIAAVASLGFGRLGGAVGSPGIQFWGGNVYSNLFGVFSPLQHAGGSSGIGSSGQQNRCCVK